MGLLGKLRDYREYAETRKVEVEKVTSRDRADYWGLSMGGVTRVYNPSDLVGKKGLKIFDEMLEDSQVKNS